MTGVDIFRNFIIELESQDTDNGRLEAVVELQALLCDSDLTHRRILYLESLRASGSDIESTDVRGIDDPMSSRQYRIIIEKGLVDAFRDGDVTTDQLAGLAHSVAGLRAFADSLVETPFSDHAECWKGALDVPFDAGEIVIPLIETRETRESVWSRMVDSAVDWLAGIAPPARDYGLGFRHGRVETSTPDFDRSGTITESENLKRQIGILEGVPGEIPDVEFPNSWGKIRWDRLKSNVSDDLTWDEFLLSTGNLIGEDLDADDLKVMGAWLYTDEQRLADYESEIKLLKLLLMSTELVDE